MRSICDDSWCIGEIRQVVRTIQVIRSVLRSHSVVAAISVNLTIGCLHQVWPGTACLSYNLSWYTCACFPWLFTHTGSVGSGLTLSRTLYLHFCLALIYEDCQLWDVSTDVSFISNSEGWAHTMVLVLLCNSCKGLGSASGGLWQSLPPVSLSISLRIVRATCETREAVVLWKCFHFIRILCISGFSCWQISTSWKCISGVEEYPRTLFDAVIELCEV